MKELPCAISGGHHCRCVLCFWSRTLRAGMTGGEVYGAAGAAIGGMVVLTGADMPPALRMWFKGGERECRGLAVWYGDAPRA